MSVLADLDMPIIAAPMAGGPSTPELVRAVSEAGGLGFLATGTVNANQAQAWMQQCAGLTYGVNVFMPQEPLEDLSEVRKLAAELGVSELPEVDFTCDFDAIFQAVLSAEHPPAVLSATFGCFSAEQIAALHERGIEAWVTVTRPEDAATATHRGADALIVQGPLAGGHRSTWTVEEEPDSRDLIDLLYACRGSLPVIAAGGITRETLLDVHQHSDAVALGSAFLLAAEAGTSSMNRQLLLAGGESVSTRAFSGRYARGLRTPFTDTHDIGPVYPYLNALLKQRRTEPEYAYCLVGAHWDDRERPAADIMEELKAIVEE
ncbi:nitronate monooxygenase [Corynebacterium tapiri]|uniref:Propionate 3-nitronate monooxygenase n=1 Tax=Corynebacterium tapiri TaxID=1448266 RepID=A0A5C4U6S5_9CORY|nr:nitronate monooxygenase [Corynebacterium tapiri]TNM00464.1 nitronate monooxygenase [Corynebacterium tapiri]